MRVLPGYDVSVSINSPKRDVKLTLTEVDRVGGGKTAGTIERRTVRKGKVTFKLPQPGATYQLRVDIGKKRFWSYIEVQTCGGTPGDKAEIRLGANPVRAGGFIPYELVNTSDVGCISVGGGWIFERLQPDGTWTLASTSGAVPAVAYSVAPDQTHSKAVTIPADFAPGRYRLKEIVGATVNGVSGPMAIYAQFDVVG